MMMVAAQTAFGAMAIHFEDDRILGWATGWSSFQRGPVTIAEPDGPLASWGSPSDALYMSDVKINDVLAVVSLGDGGSITLTFDQPIGDGPGSDLAVFENGFKDERPGMGGFDYLELAFVEVSSDGTTFHRFPAISLTQTTTQVPFGGTLDGTKLENLAGKYVREYGTPFDLAELAGIEGLNIAAITHVRIVDVVGCIDPAYGSMDSLGNLINDPWETPFETGGFDLDAVAVLNLPEPTAPLFCLLGAAMLGFRRRR